MTVFLPLLESSGDSLFGPLQRIGPVILTSPSFPLPSRNCYILPDHNVPFDIDQIIAWLDAGAEKVIVPLSWAKELAGLIPDERLLLLLDVGGVSAVSDKVRGSVSGVLLKTPSADLELITSFAQFFSQSSIYVLPSTTTPPSKAFIRELLAIGATLVIPGAQLTVSPSSPTQINIGDAFVAPLVSDRADGLFPTIVSSETGHSLGLVYSSPESIRESIITGKGVYQSRKHGLWRKGETSGASQDVVRISLDCDKDSLEFRVVQHGAGFCHLDRRSCFGAPNGIQALEEIIKSRFSTAPEGSYTKRLFDDSALLQSKIMEEADELCRAQSKTDVAAEAADLLYFALTKCVASGVSIWDIEQSLDLKAKRVTRRPGNAKPQWQKPPPPSQPHLPSPLSTGPSTSLPSRISMRLFDLAKTSAHERELLLQRPVLKSDEMISKVAPIVREVRVRGDAALLEFTAKFDKAKLDANVIRAPFSADIMTLPPDVRSAIDVAYSNIKRFHQAQVSSQPLVVETLPGVVCTRFSRPIARVGLYVPGGTAVLPSTALMLGIPAQVAGCKEVVIATPPRSDGTVSPEVAYVAHIVGATAILKAGGAQAVAAMAYGTETVPKVDKIFGPGNQWVTAAKMHVQNDTDALVSIDMPAGPSEVLVIADNTSNPAYVASDLLSQAEHGVDSQVVLIAVDMDQNTLSAIEDELDEQAHALPRVDIIRHSIAKSIIVTVSSISDAMKFSNDYAPEHLILHVQDAHDILPLVDNAGSVFVGPFTPESCGDYASGTNHTLPTNGYARQFSGVNTGYFQKHITSQEITLAGLQKLGPTVVTLAEREGLQAHANAVNVRLR